MKLPGTQLANKALDKAGLRNKFMRHYTYVRKGDRSHKIWGSFNEGDAQRLVRLLKRMGAVNPRVSVAMGFRGRRTISGVRFENPTT